MAPKRIRRVASRPLRDLSSSNPARPLLVALTGGACTGKTTVLGYFRDSGAACFSADEVARELTRRGSTLAEKLARAIGPGTLSPEGELDRAFVAKKIFADPALRTKVEQILHGPILSRLFELSANASEGIHCFEVPLLVEAQLQDRFDRVVLCRCGRKEQKARLLARWGGDEAMVRRILASQVTDRDRRPFADYVVMTNRPPELVRKRVQRIFANLKRALHVHS